MCILCHFLLGNMQHLYEKDKVNSFKSLQFLCMELPAMREIVKIRQEVDVINSIHKVEEEQLKLNHLYFWQAFYTSLGITQLSKVMHNDRK